MRRKFFAVSRHVAPIIFAGAILVASFLSAAPPERVIPLPVKAPRLLGMSMDDDGFIWLGSTHRMIYRYAPTTGAIEEIKLPYDSSTSQALCVGDKVYLLGQSFPKLIIYDRARKKFHTAAYPSARPDVWYGTEPVEGRYLYLFDRGEAGVIKWDTASDTGRVIPYPYKTILPSGGRFIAADGGVWCSVWDYTGGQYVPIGIARLDVKTDQFDGWYPFPAADAEAKPFSNTDTTVFYPHSLKGQLVPFDFKERRWCRRIAVPEFGKRFGFIGMANLHEGRWYFSLSTYNGTATGCDGQPYHFCNALLEFDPRTGRFAFPAVEAKDAYYQVSYHLVAGGHLYATGNNIREPDGTLNNARLGEAIFWQTRKRE
ncbi:MAG: hypothetical protein AB1705_12005 [Verrucomicrobiota bacterium]